MSRLIKVTLSFVIILVLVLCVVYELNGFNLNSRSISASVFDDQEDCSDPVKEVSGDGQNGFRAAFEGNKAGEKQGSDGMAAQAADRNLKGGLKEEKEQVRYAKYKGPVTHIFFHPLIVYPELAFDGDYLTSGYNEWFVTVKEFKRIIESLYEKDYVVVSLEELFEVKGEDDKYTIDRKSLMLPEGKKPLIISIDDLNYYDYMKQNGNASRVVLDENGNAAVYSISPEGSEYLERDNGIIPLLDRFIEQHPDFSQDGAKGIIALTGYQGILGYRTDKRSSPDYEQEKRGALEVVERLKSTGWTFACHGYGHLDAKKVSIDRLRKDTIRWKEEVEPLVGSSCVYIYPFGSELAPNDRKFQLMLDSNFRVFCSVGSTGFQQFTDSYILMDRINIDGTSFYYRKDKLSDLFDVDKVIDCVRPPFKTDD